VAAPPRERKVIKLFPQHSSRIFTQRKFSIAIRSLAPGPQSLPANHTPQTASANSLLAKNATSSTTQNEDTNFPHDPLLRYARSSERQRSNQRPPCRCCRIDNDANAHTCRIHDVAVLDNGCGNNAIRERLVQSDVCLGTDYDDGKFGELRVRLQYVCCDDYDDD